MADDHITYRELTKMLDDQYSKIEKKIDEGLSGYGTRLKAVEDDVLIMKTTAQTKQSITIQVASIISFTITVLGFLLNYFTFKK